MAARGWVTRQARFGWEPAPGVATTPDLITTMGEATVTPSSDQKEIRASGDLHPTIVVSTKETAEWQIENGAPCYRHLAYWFAMGYGIPTVEEIAPGVYRYTYDMTADADNLQTATIAFGDAKRAFQVARAVAAGLTVGWNIQSGDADLAVNGYARAIENAPALSETTSRIEPSYINAKHVRVSLSESLENIDNPANVITNAYAVELEVDDRSSAFETFGDTHTVITAPDASLTLQQLSDDDSLEWLARYRESRTAYVRVAAVGAELAPADGDEPAITESFTLRVAIQASEQSGESENDDATVIETAGRIVTDRDGFSSTVEIVTDAQPPSNWTA